MVMDIKMKGAGMNSNQVRKRGLTMGSAVSAVIMILVFAGNAQAEDVNAETVKIEPVKVEPPKVAPPKVNPRYKVKGATIYDTKSDLTWDRCSIGQRWKGKLGCVGIVKSFTFDEAQLQAGKGWRVPSSDELASIIDYTRKTQNQPPMLDDVAFPDMNLLKMVYWSSTPFDNKDGYYVDFHDGNIDNDTRKSAYAVRLVRGKQ